MATAGHRMIPRPNPRDVAMLDVRSVLEALGIADLHLVGYSLGARVSTLLVADGLRPQKLVLGGIGPRAPHALDYPARLLSRSALTDFDEARLGDPDYLAIQFIRQAGVDRVAMALLLRSIGWTCRSTY